MNHLLRLSHAIDWLNLKIGRSVSWLIIFMALMQFSLVVMRHVFGVSFIWFQQSMLYAHGTLFLVAAAYTYLKDAHVRVDILYHGASSKGKAISNLCGIVFLLVPLCIFILIDTWPYVLTSWKELEGSHETSGIPALFVLKSMILIFLALLILQAISEAIKFLNIILRGRNDD